MGPSDGTVITILSLGDGDFTYSCDLARYLSTRPPTNNNNNIKEHTTNATAATKTTIRLIASGIDSREELFEKYKDSPFVLGRLDSLKSSSLDVSILHGINAIRDTTTKPTNLPESIHHVDHVMFHHPHLGIEDSILHSRFLCHFFHSCVNGWMNDDTTSTTGTTTTSFVHLSLAVGQCERWKCLEAAEKQGLVLLQRMPFIPPPVENPSYHFRRHQTGKSFDSRTGGSETFIFSRRRKTDIPDNALQLFLSHGILSWNQNISTRESTTNDSPVPQPSTHQTTRLLSCPFCDREFKEERSLKCHVRDRHPDGGVSSKRSKPSLMFECVQCRTETGEGRCFETEQALIDHQRAKHSALHKDISPHYCTSTPTMTTTTNPAMIMDRNSENHDDDKDDDGNNSTVQDPSKNEIHTCTICGAIVSQSIEGEITHLDDFRPSVTVETYPCSFCGKRFHQTRAKFQHENFCSHKSTPLVKT